MNGDFTFSLYRGTVPLLVSMPHVGTSIPPQMQAAYVRRALEVEDTDWHLQRLYDFLGALGASLLASHTSRYVIDLNRPPDDAPMYPGASNTELCPTRFFTGESLYQSGQEPSPQERMRRLGLYWQPYHDALAAEITRIRAKHGFALLWDAHSIRSELPWLFEGRLPDLNIGTADGASADPTIADAMAQACHATRGVSVVVNGRFKGGYITRHYGRPEAQVHAIQLEMCQRLYMQEVAPFAYDDQLAQHIAPLLNEMVASALNACARCYEK